MKSVNIAYPPSNYFSRKEASRYLADRFGVSVAPQTLAKYASIGGGPYFEKFNRDAIYTDLDLAVWVRSKLKPGEAASDAPQAISREFILEMGGDPDTDRYLRDDPNHEQFDGEIELE